MRMSKLLLPTLREAPADAEAASHRLLLRAGFIRRLTSGVYSFLPLGLKVLSNIENIIRQEMDKAGAEEILLPALHPLEIWQQSGRAQTMKDVLMKVETTSGSFVLGPTHEEVITAIVGAEVNSYKELPLNLYQIQTKFRDEPRARFGLMRTKEFIMKDAYSFDASQEEMGSSYQTMYDAYCKIFERCDLSYQPVEADAGAIGGKVNHEFMVPSQIGEDHFASCANCRYSANLEAATKADIGFESKSIDQELKEHFTPDRPGIDLVVEHFKEQGLVAKDMLKCFVFFDSNNKINVGLVPGDRQVRLPKGSRGFEEKDFLDYPDLVKGYIGPKGLNTKDIKVVADYSVKEPKAWVSGANKKNYHYSGLVLGRDFSVENWDSLTVVEQGDPCPRCSSPLVLVRSVEAGHTFQLGLTYSKLIPGASFTDAQGKEQLYWMGCYGIGVTRLIAIIAEEHHDDKGLIWPKEIAPYAIHIISLNPHKSSEVKSFAEQLYKDLLAAGVGVIYDDREVSAGIKFADADLVGVPTQVVIGNKGLGQGIVEIKDRKDGQTKSILVDEVYAELTSGIF